MLESKPLSNAVEVKSLVVDNGISTYKWIRRSIVILLVLAAVYTATTLWAGSGAWSVALRSVSMRDVAVVVALVAVGLIIRAARWQYYLHLLRWPVPILPALAAFVASIAMTATPGKAGELVKVALLRSRYHVSIAQGAGILVIERLGDVLAVMVLAAGGLTLFADLRSYFVVCAVLVAGVAVFASQPAFTHALLARIGGVRKFHAVAGRLTTMMDAVQALLRPRPFLTGTFLALAAWSCEASAFHFLSGRLGVHSTPLVSFSIYGLAILAGALSMLPGGIGTTDVAMGFLLTRLGTPASIAAVDVVLFRLCTIWLFSLVGVLFLTGWVAVLSRRGPRIQDQRWKNGLPETAAFESATVILPVMNETTSLVETIDAILATSEKDVREFLIVVCGRTSPESMTAIDALSNRLNDKVVVLEQQLPFLGGAMRDAFDRARGSHAIMMASDLETDPALVPLLIAEARKSPSAVITTSRWIEGGGFRQYSRVKLVANWIFQRLFSLLYTTRLSDMTYGYRIFPTRLIQSIKWEELRHPFLFESLIKPLRLGVPVFELPAVWKARTEGESQNTFIRNFSYFAVGLRIRLASRHSMLRR